MKYINGAGEAIYINCVDKGHGERWIIQAASGQIIRGRDGEKQKSRTFRWEHQAAAWLRRNGYEKT